MPIESPTHPVLIDNAWRDATSVATFTATNPQTRETLPATYPVSAWEDVDAALEAASRAFDKGRGAAPEARAAFLRRFADIIEQRAEAIVEAAHAETALPCAPRLADVELPRTTGQLRRAAEAALDPSWRLPAADDKANLHSVLEPIGPVLIFGPNNFPMAFNAICGGDFAAAIAAGCPVIAKAHGLHPTTSRLLAEAANEAAEGLPTGTVQMLYGMSNDDGFRAVADRRLGAVAFTGSRGAGLALKRAADEVGKPFFAELSAVNPVVLLPGALEERFEEITGEVATSALMAAGQFCTNPGLLIAVAGEATERLIDELAGRFADASPGPLLGEGVLNHLCNGVARLTSAGARVVTGGKEADGAGFAHQNTLLRADGSAFLERPEDLQTEAFGNATLVVVCEEISQVGLVLRSLDGSLTGSIYSASDGSEDAAYAELAEELVTRVGRMLNDKMPTGVAVSPAMNHGGPFPASSNPHFTAVGLPAACRRFTRLVCYDNVRPHRLPKIFG